LVGVLLKFKAVASKAKEKKKSQIYFSQIYRTFSRAQQQRTMMCTSVTAERTELLDWLSLTAVLQWYFFNY